MNPEIRITAEEALKKVETTNRRIVMLYLGSGEHTREAMVNEGSISNKDADYLNSVPTELKNAILSRIFAILQGEIKEDEESTE